MDIYNRFMIHANKDREMDEIRVVEMILLSQILFPIARHVHLEPSPRRWKMLSESPTFARHVVWEPAKAQALR